MIDITATMQAYEEQMNHAYRSKGLTQLIQRELLYVPEINDTLQNSCR
jgi:hypothetical protein